MSSPDNFRITRYLRINRESKEAIYLQLVNQFVNAIQRGYIAVGMKLPGSRVLSEQLGIHRKTMVAALEELSAQGWAESVPNVGTFVRNPQVRRSKAIETETRKVDFPSVSAIHFVKSNLFDTENREVETAISVSDHLFDAKLVDPDELSRLFRSAMKRQRVNSSLKQNNNTANNFFLDQLSYHVNLSRGIHVSSSNISIVQSREACLHILSEILLSTNAMVLVGNPGSHEANMIFQQSGALIRSIPVDDEGLVVSYIEKHFSPSEITAVYINSHVHHPTTVPLSESRKNELISLAKRFNFFIIEDNPFYDLHFEKTISSTLIRQNDEGRIIHIGVVGNFISTTFQRAFILATPDIIKEINNQSLIFQSSHDLVSEQVLGELIEGGDYYRFMKKISKTMKERRNYVSQLLISEFKDEVHFQIPVGGTAIWVEWKKHFSLLKMKQVCKKLGLFIPNTCLFQHKGMLATRLCFGHLNFKEIEKVVATLRQAYDEVI